MEVSATFVKRFAELPRELQARVFLLATREYRVAANRIRLAYLVSKRRGMPSVFLYTPSARSGDNRGPRLVCGYTV